MNLSEFVDARFIGVSHSPASNDLVLTFLKRALRIEILAVSAERFLVTDFAEQNVVDELRLHGGEIHGKVLEERLAELLFRCSVESADKYPTFRERINEAVREIESGKKILLEVVPVVGASALILAKSIEPA